MATMKEIADRADVIFKEMYTVQDILKGNTIDMYKEAWNIARYELEVPTTRKIDKVLLGTLINTRITEIYKNGDSEVEIFTEGLKVRTISLDEIVELYQRKIDVMSCIDIPIVGADIEGFTDVILENKVIYKNIQDHDGNTVELAFMTKDEYEQRKA